MGKVLIVDDDRANRIVLKAILARYNYDIAEADNGERAVQLFSEYAPDIVLMDIMMPVMDGYEATRRIKTMMGSGFIPVIFLTAVTDEEALAKCVAAGGDDFITKPYNHIILKAKMDAMFRIKDMNDTIVSQHQELAYHHSRLNKEQEIAERIYSNIIKAGYRETPGIRYLSSPLSLFNGDLFLFATRPNGSLHVLAGDFTGHGLAAAIGALPVSDVFYAMTSAGYSIGDIVSHINQKLVRILPADLFFCATLIEIDGAEGTIAAWSGGMPDILLIDADNSIRNRICSSHLPLGILSADRFDGKLEMLAINPGERIYLYSDGITEMRNSEDRMLGQEGFESLFMPEMKGEQVYDHLVGCLDAYRLDARRDDDVTLVEVTCLEGRYKLDGLETDQQSDERDPMSWSLSLRLDKAALTQFDPLPYLNRTVMEIQGLSLYKERIYTILAELIGNAVDHGLLGLDSRCRATTSGFDRYYQERETRLRDGKGGWIEVTIRHVNDSGYGRLVIVVKDSGSGFSMSNISSTLEDTHARSGRGIPLVTSLCQSLSYNQEGNSARAVLEWTSDQEGDSTAREVVCRDRTEAGGRS